jgi:hypothetical protein
MDLWAPIRLYPLPKHVLLNRRLAGLGQAGFQVKIYPEVFPKLELRPNPCDSFLKPGGWVEFQDVDALFYSDDSSLTDEHDLRKWCVQIIDTFSIVGREPNPGPFLRKWIEDAGFVNISHKTLKMPIGIWPKEPRFVGPVSLPFLHVYQILRENSSRKRADWFVRCFQQKEIGTFNLVQ